MPQPSRILAASGKPRNRTDMNAKRAAVVTYGCQMNKYESERMVQRVPHVDLVFGPQNIPKLPFLLEQVQSRRQQLSDLADNPIWDEQLFPIRRESSFQAWVTVMQGCDKFCTFCVVPYTRGREQSRATAVIYREVQSLAEQ